MAAPAQTQTQTQSQTQALGSVVLPLVLSRAARAVSGFMAFHAGQSSNSRRFYDDTKLHNKRYISRSI